MPFVGNGRDSFIFFLLLLFICVHRIKCVFLCVCFCYLRLTFLLHTRIIMRFVFCFLSHFFSALLYFTLIHRSSRSDLVFSVHKSPTIKETHRNDDFNATNNRRRKKPLTIHSAFYMNKNRRVKTN